MPYCDICIWKIFKHWGINVKIHFLHDFDWIGEKISTHETGFYKKIFQRHDETQDKFTFKNFVVPIANAKNVEEINFHIDAPMLKYLPNTYVAIWH